MICPVCNAPETRQLAYVDGKAYLRCEVCVATFLDPKEFVSRTAEYKHYRTHNNDVTDPGYRKFLSRLADPLIDRMPPSQRGLDYGCGPGPALAAMLRDAGHAVDVYDPFFAPDNAVLAATYDFVTCTEVVEHFRHPVKEFAKINKLLKPNSWFGVMTAFQPEDADFSNWYYRKDPTHVVFYGPETFQKISDTFGWTCEFPRDDVVIFRKPGETGRARG